MSQRKNPVVHFEMPYEDQDRMMHFYKEAFGWDMIALGAQMQNYVMAHTTETDAQNMIQTPGTINGGFYPRPDDVSAQYPSVTIAVEDIAAAIERVRACGGAVLGEPIEIPGIGRYVAVKDSEGNRVSMLQPIMPESAA